jgi:DNA-directed RNA polymerase specialized sigma24 family protein
MKTTSQKISNRLPQESKQVVPPAARKHDAELAAARLNPAWVEFEAGIYANDFLRARITRALDRYGLGSSSAMVDEALDFLIWKDLGAVAQYFNQTGRAGFSRRHVSHAVISFMSRKEQQRHLTDLPIQEDESDHDYDLAGTIPASHIHDDGTLSPDEAAARAEARRAFYTLSAAIPAQDRELYALLLGLGQTGTRLNIEAYARRMGIGISTVYDRLKKLGRAIQQHPLFAQIAATYQTT